MTQSPDIYSVAIQKFTDIYEKEGKRAYEEKVARAWKFPTRDKELGCLFRSLARDLFCPTIINATLKGITTGWGINIRSINISSISKFPELEKAILEHPSLPNYVLSGETVYNDESGRYEHVYVDSYPLESLEAFADIQRLAERLIPDREKF